MNKQFRRHTKRLSPGDMTAARDYYYTMKAAKCDPLCVTPESLAKGRDFLIGENVISAGVRSLAWVRALHALPEDYQRQIGADKIPKARWGSARAVRPEDGTFPTLEQDLIEIRAIALRPRADVFDEHEPRSGKSLDRCHKRALIMAGRLHNAGLVDTNVSLGTIVSLPMQQNYLALAFGLISPNGEVSEGGTAAPEATSAPRFHLYGDFSALSLLSSAVEGKDSPEAVFARAQMKEHQVNGLTDEAISIMTRLTQPANLLKISGLDDAWIQQAEMSSNKKTRASMADLAAAVSIYKIAPVRPASWPQ